MKKLTIFVLVFLLSPIAVYPHSGGTNADGCHTNRKTGDYHCHNKKKKGIPSSSKPSFSPHNKSNPSFKLSVSRIYQRRNWKHWIDEDGDCQNTRAEILIRDSQSTVQFKSKGNCRVTNGEWIGPYTNQIFIKASELDIDHIVPLKHAYSTGGDSWTREKKKWFANDFENLLAVDKSANRRKGAKGPDQWKPTNTKYWCEYAERWRWIKEKYGLVILTNEELALQELEEQCN